MSVFDGNDNKGLLITFEGGEGVGKSTQIRLLAARLEAAGYETALLRDPGGTAIGEKIRAILLDRANTQLDAASELLLYEAARAQLVAEHVIPALRKGMVVLCDRFSDSTLAYQGAARGLGIDLVRQANAIGCHGVVPDRTIILTRDVDSALKRATKDGADRLEAEDIAFHVRVHAAFTTIAAEEPDRVRVLENKETKAETAAIVFDAVKDLFPLAAAASFEITPELLRHVKEDKRGNHRESAIVGVEESAIVGVEKSDIVGAEKSDIVGAEKSDIVGVEKSDIVGAQEEA